jgi:hypothetical protein
MAAAKHARTLQQQQMAAVKHVRNVPEHSLRTPICCAMTIFSPERGAQSPRNALNSS